MSNNELPKSPQTLRAGTLLPVEGFKHHSIEVDGHEDAVGAGARARIHVP